MEQEQRARQRGQPPDRGDPATIIQLAHDITCAATAARQSRKASDRRCSPVLNHTPRPAAISLLVRRCTRWITNTRTVLIGMLISHERSQGKESVQPFVSCC